MAYPVATGLPSQDAYGQYLPYATLAGEMTNPYQQYEAGYAQSVAAPITSKSQTYSFVMENLGKTPPRPRRRPDEIDRKYLCGWNGCEKAYGTLNHLNGHVTAQDHGQKRTSQEFSKVREERKARKKEKEAIRKANEERSGPDPNCSPLSSYSQLGQQMHYRLVGAGPASGGAPFTYEHPHLSRYTPERGSFAP
ncbi:hypothetical protein B0H63DRAFT_508391 [Podospora didyma]|uniref:C2H2-type domain-containing protein n=1 Tax=Podospora didyma TaxID=330526 RepID=A0AAE0U4X8_9PEZI|nr:hypothetical protein B0H63DRAFT_508391 [Podospora didyma]